MLSSRSWNAVLVFLALLVGGVFVYYWQFAFNSDFAMIGLLAKRILETGEQFIFVPKVGYQGLLYECNLVALMFRLFGVSPRVLNFAPYLTYLGLCLVFYGAVKAWHSASIAKLATAFLILSSPHFYGQVLRTQPNYGEIYLSGCALFWMYRVIIQEGIEFIPRRKGLLFGFGLLAGFGLYTYGQMIYFLGAIGLHFALFMWADIQGRIDRLGIQKRGIKEWFFILSEIGLTYYFILFFLFFLFEVQKVSILGHRISWDPVNTVLVPFFIYGLIVGLTYVMRPLKNLWTGIQCVAIAGIGFLIGYAPSLYYHFVLHGTSLSHFRISGTRNEFLNRLGFFFNGWMTFTHTNDSSLGLGISLSGLMMMGLFSAFLLYSIYGVKRFCRLKDQASALSVSPYFLLFFVSMVAYIGSPNAIDVETRRYVLVMVLSISVGLSWAIHQLYGRFTSEWQRRALYVGAMLLLGSNSWTLYHAIHDAKDPYPMETVAHYLKEKGYKGGYGEYWHAYVTTFLSNEEVILEPIWSNYLPYYESKVRSMSEIVYLDSKPYAGGLQGREGVPGDSLVLGSIPYEVLSKEAVGKVDVFVLKKKM